MSDLSNTSATAVGGLSLITARAQLDTNAQVLVELRVISYLLAAGLNINEDLDTLRNNEANALNL